MNIVPLERGVTPRLVKLRQLAQRFLVPAWLVSLVCLVRFRARVSTRAEVELSPHVSFGRGTTISSFTKIKATEGPLTTGIRCGFATGCFVSAGRVGVRLGDHVICGPNVVILGMNYRYDQMDVSFEDQGHTSKGVTIGNNVWIGAGAVIADGSEIGDNTIVVANSLVNRRYPPNVIIQGAPAKILMRRGRSQEHEARDAS
jgi:acetyltransferase-like isoleucine patch superfamily enzyme